MSGIRLRNVILGFAIGLTATTLLCPKIKKVLQGKYLTTAAGQGPRDPDYFKGLPLDVSVRIMGLHGRRYNPCVRMPFEIERVSGENDLLDSNAWSDDLQTVFQTAKGQGRINCFATVYYIVSGKDPIYISGERLKKLLGALGYKNRGTMDLLKFRNGSAGKAIQTALDGAGLIPADVLIFSSGFSGPQNCAIDPTVHASMYLGRSDGEHYMFQKKNRQCGPGSPYDRESLVMYIAGNLGKRIKGFPNNAELALLEVWRKDK